MGNLKRNESIFRCFAVHTFVCNEIISKCLQIASEMMKLHESVIVKIRDDNIFGISWYINNLVLKETIFMLQFLNYSQSEW